ncbi:uncharacterized protein LOC108162554 [Drosophila miranda]|uniref:uncharacterized protein LOC108162554 n=1 Tax=Drosophila miranda TaxID=7229 RepID=UPI0007E5D0CF|nr:uncharacterized protein LOC108162554 [Drosophila miranda]
MEHNRNTARTISRAKKVINQNGQLILQAILHLNRLCTYADIVEQLLIRVNRSSFEPHILHAIAIILKEAVRFGFIQKLGGRYCVMFNPVSETPEIRRKRTQERAEESANIVVPINVSVKTK